MALKPMIANDDYVLNLDSARLASAYTTREDLIKMGMKERLEIITGIQDRDMGGPDASPQAPHASKETGRWGVRGASDKALHRCI